MDNNSLHSQSFSTILLCEFYTFCFGKQGLKTEDICSTSSILSTPKTITLRGITFTLGKDGVIVETSQGSANLISYPKANAKNESQASVSGIVKKLTFLRVLFWF